MKNIILLSDGTGNSNIKDRGTNVFKLYEAIDFHSTKREQVAFYDDGVGTEDLKPLKIMGGAFGWGLSRNIRKLYKDLVQSYNEGDEIYLFGFSRGAFTVRSLAGFVIKQGILKHDNYATDEELDNAIWHHYENYRSKHQAYLEKPVAKLRRKVIPQPKTLATHNQDKVVIKFMGVWDTVDAVGLPFDEAASFLNTWIFHFKFPDQNLPDCDLNKKIIKQACHALSIDDERRSFKPLLWNHDDRIEQVWFAGVHANVGGGYPQQGLSIVTLDWMMKKAKAAGLNFIQTDLDFARNREYAFDKLYDSRSGLGTYYRYKMRDIAEICRVSKISPVIHESTIQRIAEGILNYAPGNFPNNFTVVNDDGEHPNSARIVNIINPNASTPVTPNTQPLLLNQHKGLILQRSFLYYAFLSFTIFTLYQLILGSLATSGAGVFGEIKTLVSPDGLLDKLALLCWQQPKYAVTALLIFVASIWTRKKLTNEFTASWGTLRDQLKSLVPMDRNHK